jgi:glyoxylase-like metal-dependent hydrolase (beta-lactamase superfamily II)
VKTLDGPNLSEAPDRDEIEVSVFGPGYGESIVVHLTRGLWITVDSCIDKKSGLPAAVNYFETIGVNAAKDVLFVISSHWHDDHVRGIGKLFETCESARFVCAHGLGTEQFKELIKLYSRYFATGGSGVREFSKVMRVLTARRKKNSLIAPEFADAGKIIFENGSDAAILVKALSPSSAAVAASLARFAADILPTVGQQPTRIPTLGPNDLALAITLRVGGNRILLGADLEEDGREGIGWREVVTRFAHIDNGHHGIKVPHHGSVTGHHDEVWSKMLDPEPWAIITPYSRTNPPLPTESDIERIRDLCSCLLVTARKQASRFSHSDPMVRKQLREMNVVISEEPAAQGLVRIRKSASNTSSDWTVELFGDACTLHP